MYKLTVWLEDLALVLFGEVFLVRYDRRASQLYYLARVKH